MEYKYTNIDVFLSIDIFSTYLREILNEEKKMEVEFVLSPFNQTGKGNE
jgi:hypothetical protein